MVLEHVGLRRDARLRRELKQSEGISGQSAGAEIRIALAGQRYTGITALVAVQANILSQSGRQSRGVHNQRLGASRTRTPFAPLPGVRSPGSVAVLAPNGFFEKRGRLEQPRAVRHRLRPVARTGYAACFNRPVEGGVIVFVAG